LRTDNEYNEYVKDFYRKVEDYDWNDVADNWRGLESFVHRAREREIKKLIGVFSDKGRCLDVGCGTGLLLRHLSSGSIGVDINPRHVERAKAYVPGAQVMVQDAEKLQFDEETFDMVICTEVIEHLVRPDLALENIRRVLKRGGVLLGSTPKRSLLWRFRFLSSTHYHNEPFHNEYSEAEVTKLLSGYKIEMVRSVFYNSIYVFVARKV